MIAKNLLDTYLLFRSVVEALRILLEAHVKVMATDSMYLLTTNVVICATNIFVLCVLLHKLRDLWLPRIDNY